MRIVAVGFWLMMVLTACAQGSKEDYARANGLGRRTRGAVLNASVRVQWLKDGHHLWYRRELPKGEREYVLVDLERGTRRLAFDHVRLAKALQQRTERKYDLTRLPLERMEVIDETTVRLAVQRQGWAWNSKTHQLTKSELPAASAEPGKSSNRQAHPRRREQSPNGRWEVKVREHNLVLRDRKNDKTYPLTKEGKSSDSYQGGVYWAPDSSRFVAIRTKRGTDRRVHIIESSPRDQLQPKLHSYGYRKPGDDIDQRKPHLFDVASQKEIPLDDMLYSNPWRIDKIRWARDSSRFTFAYNQRGHQVLRILSVDGKSGDGRAIVDEQSKTFLDYAYKSFVWFLDETNEILWTSERDGWNHLYLYDAITGKVKNQVTQGKWVVRHVDYIDEKNREVWFRAGGVDPEQDPYQLHYCRVRFDGSEFVKLTEGDGSHSVEYSPNDRYLLDTYSRVDHPPVTEVRRISDGSRVCVLEAANIDALLATGWQKPIPFVTKGRDSSTDIYGVIYRPTTFDAKQKYPVIEKIYAGPHGAFVPKTFRPYHSAQTIAELGFIVVQIDGMGTSHRSKAFHDVCWKNLGDSGFPDRILWMQAAAKAHPYMDLSRAGIYGGSAGGQSTLRGLLAHPEFYKVGVADCGCHDNRMDKIWWNEQWMGWPIGPHYKEQSNVTNAHKLQGKLLLTVGELDRNVDPASTMQVVNALIRANKDFDLIVFPGAGHGAGGSAYGRRRRQDFFVRHLLGVEPRWE